MNDNDYSLLLANTGLGTVTAANALLNGTGNVVTVFTSAGDNGSIIKTITIKALQQSLQGMVRLFIKTNDMTPKIALYREVPIPIQPQAASVPIPTPKYLMYETVLVGDLKLQSGYSLIASTQNAESFNVIVEGLDWNYPDPVPDVCCNFEQEDADTGIGTVTTANANMDGTGSVTIFTANGSENGALIKNITIKALQSTHEGIVRLFVYDGTTYYLMREILVPQTNQSGFEPSWKQVVAMNFNLAPGYIISATTDTTQSFALTTEATNWSYPS